MSDNNAPHNPRNQPPRRSGERPQAYNSRQPQRPNGQHPQQPARRSPQQMRPDNRPPRAVVLIYIVMAVLIVGILVFALSVMLNKEDANSSDSGGSSAISNDRTSSDNSQGSAPEAPNSSGAASNLNSSGAASEPSSSGAASEPNSSGTASEPNSSGTASEPTSTVTPAESSDTSYEIDPPASSDGLTILGPNMVYFGEKFSYSCASPDGLKYSHDVEWECVGDSGTITDDGQFTATKRGEVTLIAKDTTNNLSAKLLVHVVRSADEVDFIPMVNNVPVVNKTYPLPSDYAPGGLTAETSAAFKKLAAGAAADGINLFVVSGYRSYTKQQGTYAYWCSVYGTAEADRISARPGFSEHQLGMAIDVNSLEESFADTAEGKWLKEHCWEYGFIIRYPKEKEHLTGYAYEPWHIRYLGKDLAKKVTDSGLCLEEYLGIDSGYRG